MSKLSIPLAEQSGHFELLREMRWLQIMPLDRPKRLQQAWRHTKTGEVEWRDVPTFYQEPEGVA